MLSTMPHAAPTIILVDDDPDIRELVSNLLTREGFAVTPAESGRALDVALRQGMPDLIILDLMLPGEDGLSICRRLRTTSHVPILMLTAKSDETDRVVGLELGADDYLSKPFGPRELLARVRAILRRAGLNEQLRQPKVRRFAFDRFILDLDARVVMFGDEPAGLTSAEFDLLACFVEHPRRVLSRDQILDYTHGRQADPLDRTVDILVSRLRRKLETLDPESRLITTVRNGGYLMTATVRQAP
ncbi:DNA-binding response OmpR family regulator [Rhizobium rosettiformans]|uniref:Regulatory protein VirG n=2 Tax=Rhizobium rosettiformans TaxID=1368430 RepID=A0A7W8MBQ2_9HYPH|nr:response regulator transcription factor [Rhizobium rosettiformans]MBB5274394.1 DNA-binding response OmpR family regulator [Rhizobium rosettiformans]